MSKPKIEGELEEEGSFFYLTKINKATHTHTH